MRGGSSQEDDLDVRINQERQDMELEAQLELENPDQEEDLQNLATLLAGDLHIALPRLALLMMMPAILPAILPMIG